MDDPLRQPAQVFHQHRAQRDGHGPQLTDGERLHTLVGRHKAAQQFRVESAVRVRNEGPCHTEHAWIVLQVTGRQFGQLSVEARRHVIADLAKLFVDNVEVIDQPLGCGGNLMLLMNRPGNGPVGFQQHAPVLQDTRSEQPTRPRFGEHDLRSRKERAVGMVANIIPMMGRMCDQLTEQLNKIVDQVRRLPNYQINWPAVRDVMRDLHDEFQKLRRITNKCLGLVTNEEHRRIIRDLSEHIDRKIELCQSMGG